MRKEWNGLLVGKDEYEEKHPQLEPFGKVADPEAIKNARPETDLANQRTFQYGFNPVGFKTVPGIVEENDLVATGQVGTVTLFFPKTLGSEATGEVGDVTVIVACFCNGFYFWFCFFYVWFCWVCFCRRRNSCFSYRI